MCKIFYLADYSAEYRYRIKIARMTDTELIEQMARIIWVADLNIELDGFINETAEYYRQAVELSAEGKRRSKPELFTQAMNKMRAK